MRRSVTAAAVAAVLLLIALAGCSSSEVVPVSGTVTAEDGPLAGADVAFRPADQKTAGLGGSGINKLAILDPNDTQVDARSGATVMKEILTIAGVTPDPDFPGVPGAVREWCINTAAVDPITGTVLANSEDGKLYRWDLTTNTFTQVITLTPGIGEAYTPTVIGPDGTVFAINAAILDAVGK